MANVLLCPYFLLAMFSTYRLSPEVEVSIAQSTYSIVRAHLLYSTVLLSLVEREKCEMCGMQSPPSSN